MASNSPLHFIPECNCWVISSPASIAIWNLGYFGKDKKYRSYMWSIQCFIEMFRSYPAFIFTFDLYHFGENTYSISTPEVGSISSYWNPTECKMLLLASNVSLFRA